MQIMPKNSGIITVTDISLACLWAWCALVWAAGGCDPVGSGILLRIIPYAALYICLRTLFHVGGKYADILILTILSIWCIAESLLGLFQVCGLRHSNHYLFSMTGHFMNPGPFGGFLACILSVAIASLILKRSEWSNHVLAIPVLAIIAGGCILPASMSRSAWIGVLMASTVALNKRKSIYSVYKHHHLLFWGSLFFVLALLVIMFLLKRESALGRIHIWSIDFLTICKHPLFGSGLGMGQGAYGITQESFFLNHPELMNTWRGKVAGCPEYAFNDFLHIGMETGVLGLAFAICAIASSVVALYKKNSPFVAGLVCWCIFACASYPLSIPRLSILAVVFMASSGAPNIENKPLMLSVFLCMITVIASVFPIHKILEKSYTNDYSEYNSKYNIGYSLFLSGNYEESIEELTRGNELSSDPMFRVIMGRNKEALGKYDEAEKEYVLAHYRVPCRLYPLVRLMRLQLLEGRNSEAEETARQIILMPVNQKNASMKRLHEEVLITLDSLERIKTEDLL